jgi:hypothetical protein
MACFSGPEIENNNLIFSTDIVNIKSYSGSGDSWKNVMDGYSSTGSSIPSSFNSPVSISTTPLTALTVIAVVELLGTNTTYAYHPISKWTNTTNATFVLYHFQQFTDNLRTYLLQWYGNRGGVWGALSGGFTGSIDSTYHITLQYNSTSGGQLWINGSKQGGRAASGTLMNNNIAVNIDGGPTPRSDIHHTKEAAIWDTELTDAQIIQHFEAVRGKYGI